MAEKKTDLTEIVNLSINFKDKENFSKEPDYVNADPVVKSMLDFTRNEIEMMYDSAVQSRNGEKDAAISELNAQKDAEISDMITQKAKENEGVKSKEIKLTPEEQEPIDSKYTSLESCIDEQAEDDIEILTAELNNASIGVLYEPTNKIWKNFNQKGDGQDNSISLGEYKIQQNIGTTILNKAMEANQIPSSEGLNVGPVRAKLYEGSFTGNDGTVERARSTLLDSMKENIADALENKDIRKNKLRMNMMYVESERNVDLENSILTTTIKPSIYKEPWANEKTWNGLKKAKKLGMYAIGALTIGGIGLAAFLGITYDKTDDNSEKISDNSALIEGNTQGDQAQNTLIIDLQKDVNTLQDEGAAVPADVTTTIENLDSKVGANSMAIAKQAEAINDVLIYVDSTEDGSPSVILYNPDGAMLDPKADYTSVQGEGSSTIYRVEINLPKGEEILFAMAPGADMDLRNPNDGGIYKKMANTTDGIVCGDIERNDSNSVIYHTGSCSTE